MSAYTKGWTFEAGRFNNPEHDDKLGSIVDSEDFIVAEVCSDAPDSSVRAALLAAAPELLEALKTLIDVCDGNYRELTEEMQLLIDRAEGK